MQRLVSLSRARVKKMKSPSLLPNGDSLQTAVFAGAGLFKRFPLSIISVSLSQNGNRLRKFSVPADSDPCFTGNLQVSR
jgi:hypothetical protein